MTEKRFKLAYEKGNEAIFEDLAHPYPRRMTNKEVERKLNEQQATIKSKDKQLGRLYNYFQDYLKDEMSGNAFSEMWDFVKEDEKWEDE